MLCEWGQHWSWTHSPHITSPNFTSVPHNLVLVLSFSFSPLIGLSSSVDPNNSYLKHLHCNFYQNMIIPALTGEKLDKIWRKNIPITYLSKIRQLLAKNLLRVSEKLQIWHTGRLPYAEKKLFSPGPATLRKWDLKYTNILYFFSSSKNICCGILRLVFNWSLHDCVLGRQGRELKLISCMQSNHPQIYIESETEPKYSPKYFVWNNHSIRKWVLWWRSSLNL